MKAKRLQRPSVETIFCLCLGSIIQGLGLNRIENRKEIYEGGETITFYIPF